MHATGKSEKPGQFTAMPILLPARAHDFGGQPTWQTWPERPVPILAIIRFLATQPQAT
ncbi:hypothetical protein HMPREF9371_0710 [Neisseria shayeganii 871]|uniref:Uncharacterized protein n=1 Tax=Neisseria shayeganii 871 TaxID=1032488 RepID=G4CGH1_9NEIS|nr:hypothetical protein HMPREF9371_0710 [Neisseria shayeganii 871]